MVHKVLCVYLPVDRILSKTNRLDSSCVYQDVVRPKNRLKVGFQILNADVKIPGCSWIANIANLRSLESISKARSRGIWFGCDLSSLDLSRLLLLFIHG
ncbi:hypothetical protein F2Q68_00005735 [Brassica cretica]|uniref:Uncharacterized protein n=1 Tax=Brassica cretica TaxID=69181 RepID=A0A8S9JHB4_BRACR|nr:hypothetical protein F2Q68_00005735 [Brassica cretica]